MIESIRLAKTGEPTETPPTPEMEEETPTESAEEIPTIPTAPEIKETSIAPVAAMPPPTNYKVSAEDLTLAFHDYVDGAKKMFHLGLLALIAKAERPRGEFMPWLERECPNISYGAVSNSMRGVTRLLTEMGCDNQDTWNSINALPSAKSLLQTEEDLPRNLSPVRRQINEYLEGKSARTFEIEMGIRSNRALPAPKKKGEQPIDFSRPRVRMVLVGGRSRTSQEESLAGQLEYLSNVPGEDIIKAMTPEQVQHVEKHLRLLASKIASEVVIEA